MQGRLSPPVAGRIQSFPWGRWEEEFEMAASLGLAFLEWTLDADRLRENPLMTSEGRATIEELSRFHGVGVPSVTGDCFMQAPLWKVTGPGREGLEDDMLAVLGSCIDAGVSMIVIPLVDGGSIADKSEEQVLVDFLQRRVTPILGSEMRLLFESDLGPEQLGKFMEQLDPVCYGINYDIGNSASLGYNPRDEFRAYGAWIGNVHVKDRALAGTTVPLGEGAADFDTVFGELGQLGYDGNFVLQTARDVGGDDLGVAARYASMTEEWIRRHCV